MTMKKRQSKKARIEQLEAQLREKDRKIGHLEDDIACYTHKFEAMQNMANSIPEGCEPGEYCRACEFSAAYHMYMPETRHVEWAYLCNKAGSCKNFVQRKMEDGGGVIEL